MKHHALISFLILVSWGLSVRGQVIYEDDFNGPAAVELNGLPPDIDANGGTNTWIAHSSWRADGTPGPYSSATLPFAAAAGRVYRLSARLANVVGDKDWLAVGFAAGSSTEQSNEARFITGATAGQPWMLRRGDSTTLDDQTFAGPGTQNGQDIAETLDRSSDVDFCLILDTRSDHWRALWYQKRSDEADYQLVRQFTYASNPAIAAVGLACANTGTTGRIERFRLEEPADTLRILAGGQPADIAVRQGETATFQVTFTSDSTPSATWYRRESTGDAPLNPADPNILATVEYDNQADSYTARLAIQQANRRHEGQYHCRIENESPFSLSSDTARLRVLRLVAHWSLDQTDFDGAYRDAVQGLRAQPAGTPIFAAGPRSEPAGAVRITPAGGWAASQTFGIDPAEGFSICLWARANSAEPGDQDLLVESDQSGYVVAGGVRTGGFWQHICLTYENDRAAIYINGRLRLSQPVQFPAAFEAALEIANTQAQRIFDGTIDDIRIYNYALDATQIQPLATGRANCTQEYASRFDVSGPWNLPDCTVNVYDLAELSRAWLSCGRYPHCD
ncbi:MAG: immunoglobulin domain-containing protein [Sedimentisphaerales bacterium]|nr:immunoglobulin domain-containing protein [Sedimentisphaerales bacterium]